jgi:hypothetical protein
MLHIRCGDDILSRLDEAGLPGVKHRWADPLCEGPVPEGLDDAAFRSLRAAYIAERCRLDTQTVLEDLTYQDKALEQAIGQDEVVLWFEHDLFDQIILIHLLDQLDRIAPGVPLSLICIDRHEGFERFIGLGDLDAGQLGALFGTRRPVLASMVEAARAALRAFRAPDPSGLVAIIRAGTPELLFLAAALKRHLQQFPWLKDGLSLTERRILEAIAADATTPSAIFRYVQNAEQARWQGDWFQFASMRDLAGGPAPALHQTDDDWPRGVEFRLTEAGRALLAGQADWFRLNQRERWVGGIHLPACVPVWRYAEKKGEPVLSVA